MFAASYLSNGATFTDLAPAPAAACRAQRFVEQTTTKRRAKELRNVQRDAKTNDGDKKRFVNAF